MTTKETPEESRGRISREIDAQRARRPNGYATRCELCAFWEVGTWDNPEDRNEDTEGECHRHAPRIPHAYSAKALGLIAWSIEELANVEHENDFDYAFESQESPFHDWPRMCAHDWCGDFQKSTHEEKAE
jgi:hypothetical protein